MDLIPSLIIALTAPRVAAIAYYPTLARGSATRRVRVLLALAPVVALALLVPPTWPIVRWLVAVDAAVIVFKLWDLHLGRRRHGFPGLRDYVAHIMITTPWNFSYRLRDAAAEIPDPPGRIRATLMSTLAAGGALVMAVFVVDLGRVHFVLDHGAKAISAVVLVSGGMNLAAMARARITGRATLLPFDAPLLAATPAEFWRRWNRSVSQFLRVAVFEPCGGRRRPVVGLLTVFAVSGLLHEYIYSVALGKIQGYQLAFFGLHAAAVILTARVRPTRATRHWWRAGAWLFLLLTSVLFFASNVNLFAHVITWHPHGAWLP